MVTEINCRLVSSVLAGTKEKGDRYKVWDKRERVWCVCVCVWGGGGGGSQQSKDPAVWAKKKGQERVGSEAEQY